MGNMTADVPKPLLPLGGKPIIQHQFELLKRHGLTDVTILAGYLGEQFEQRFGDGSALGLQLSYLKEPRPMGTAGALSLLAEQVDEDFLLFSGDIMMNFDLHRFISWHRTRPDSALTVVVHPSDHPLDSDLLEVDVQYRIQRLLIRPHPQGLRFQNLSIASAYIVSPRILPLIETEHKSDLEKDLFPRLMAAGLPLYAYATHEYLKDTGTPQRLARTEVDLNAGKIARAHRSCARPAVFLDRDGVLNQERDPLLRVEDLELIPGAAEAVRELNRAGFLAVVITNQAALAKGFLSEAELQLIHNRLETELGQHGAYLDGIYYCPHHPEKGFEGERPELKQICTCRKPESGLFEQACQEFNIDRSCSHFIGDSYTDYLAAQKAGVCFWGVRTGHALQDGSEPMPEQRLWPDLAAVVHEILEHL